MTTPENLSDAAKRTIYWARVGFGIREGLKMHRRSGQLAIDPQASKDYALIREDPQISGEYKVEMRKKRRPWGNVTEHCLVEVARTETLARWIGLPEDIIADMKMAAILHDAFKKQEIIRMREAEKKRESPLVASKAQAAEDARTLQEAGFSDLVIRLASSAGGQAAELLETDRILHEPVISKRDLAYLINHLVDDWSIGSDCVKPKQVDAKGKQSNINDLRAEENKSKPGYRKVSEEVGEELKGHPVFNGMNNHDVMVLISHRIEEKLAQTIQLKTGEKINPLDLPELVDRKIQEAIANVR